MNTLRGVCGFRFVCYPLDHWPPHVHAIRNNERCKIQLLPVVQFLEPPLHLNRADQKALLLCVERMLPALLLLWRKAHPGGPLNPKP